MVCDGGRPSCVSAVGIHRNQMRFVPVNAATPGRPLVSGYHGSYSPGTLRETREHRSRYRLTRSRVGQLLMLSVNPVLVWFHVMVSQFLPFWLRLWSRQFKFKSLHILYVYGANTVLESWKCAGHAVYIQAWIVHFTFITFFNNFFRTKYCNHTSIIKHFRVTFCPKWYQYITF